MKKILLLFFVLDLIFVGVLLKFNHQRAKPGRTVASAEDEAAPTEDLMNGLTEGQAQKLELLRSLEFSKTDQKITLKTGYLQSICAGYSLITLKFKAVDMAVSGQAPEVAHTYSCALIQQDSSQDRLETDVAAFLALQQPNEDPALRAVGFFPGEDFPDRWKLYEIQVSGELSFTVNEAELDGFSVGQNYNFSF